MTKFFIQNIKPKFIQYIINIELHFKV